MFKREVQFEELPGRRLKHMIISWGARANHGKGQALERAFEQVRQAYLEAVLGKDPRTVFHLVLTEEAQPVAEGDP